MEGYFNQESKWAIVLIDKDNIDKMYTSTNEQPILIGFSPN
jgi:glucosamine 6-phosphate synthetase-like amidotransferase/phosphosugar isomerase protein